LGIIFAEALREGAYETSNTVSVIATATNTVVGPPFIAFGPILIPDPIPVGFAPIGLAVTPATPGDRVPRQHRARLGRYRPSPRDDFREMLPWHYSPGHNPLLCLVDWDRPDSRVGEATSE
jgi:hypothetical protein